MRPELFIGLAGQRRIVGPAGQRRMACRPEAKGCDCAAVADRRNFFCSMPKCLFCSSDALAYSVICDTCQSAFLSLRRGVRAPTDVDLTDDQSSEYVVEEDDSTEDDADLSDSSDLEDDSKLNVVFIEKVNVSPGVLPPSPDTKS